MRWFDSIKERESNGTWRGRFKKERVKKQHEEKEIIN